MKRNVKVIRTAAFALLPVFWAGCALGKDAELVKFNDQIVASNKKLAQAAWEFRSAIIPLSNNQPANATAVKNAHDKLVATVKEIKEARKTVKPPEGQAPEALHKAYDQFLKGQERLVEGQFASIVRYVENRTMPTADKWANIQKLIAEIQSAEQSDFGKVQEAQNKYAEGVSMKLVNPATEGGPNRPPGGK